MYAPSTNWHFHLAELNFKNSQVGLLHCFIFFYFWLKGSDILWYILTNLQVRYETSCSAGPMSTVFSSGCRVQSLIKENHNKNLKEKSKHNSLKIYGIWCYKIILSSHSWHAKWTMHFFFRSDC